MWSEPQERISVVESEKQDAVTWLRSSHVGRLDAPAWLARDASIVAPVCFRKVGQEAQQVHASHKESYKEETEAQRTRDESAEHNRKQDMLEEVGAANIHEEKTDKELLDQAYKRGLEEGRSQAKGEILKQLEKDFEEKSVDAIRRLGALVGQIRRESRVLLVELSTAMAGKILQRDLQQDEDWIMRNIQSCLDRRVPNGPMRLRVNPKIRDILLATKPSPAWMDEMTSDGPAVKLVADVNMKAGDCILESDRMRIDARLDVQLDSVQQMIESTMAGALLREDT